MPGELLSRDELESLFRAPAQRPGRPPRAAEAFRWPALQSGGLRVAEPPNEAELVHLRALQQRFAGHLSRAATPLLGCPLRVVVNQVAATDGRAWMERGPRPACLLVLSAGGADCPPVVEMSHDVLGAILDRMLGGGPDSAPLAPRPLTEIEQRLVARFAAVLCAALESAWCPESCFTPDRIECDPQQCHELRSQRRLLEVGFTLALGRASGSLALVVPQQLVPTPGNPSDQQPGSASAGADAEAACDEDANADAGTVELVVRLAETQITAGELLGLRVGDVITTDHPHDQPLQVLIDGQPRWQGRVGSSQGRKAVKLIEEPPPVDGDAAEEDP